MWAQPLGSGLLAALVLWRVEPGRRGLAVLVGGLVLVLLEMANSLFPVWRYTLLPTSPLARGTWWVLFSSGGALWTLAMPWVLDRFLPGGEIRRRSIDLLLHGGAALSWVLFMAVLGAGAPSGVRLNLSLETGLLLVAGGLALAAAMGSRLLRNSGKTPAAETTPAGGVDRAAWGAGVALGAAFLFSQLFSLASLDGPVRDLPGALPSEAESIQLFGFPTVRSLADVTSEELMAQVPAVNPDRARLTVGAAALAMHRGIGVGFARALWSVGIRSPGDLQTWNGEALFEALVRSGTSYDRLPRPAWVEAWIRP